MVRKRSREILNTYNKKYKKSQKGKEASKRNSQKRRAKKNTTKVVVENFSYKDIFLRDNYVCCICGLPINPLLSFPDKHSVSLEHKTPLSKAGPHSKDNCGPSHLICNIRKGAKILELSFDGASI